MAKKKLLSEAVVRRFMGLAGMDSKVVSNVISEMMYEEEPAADEELPPEAGEEEPVADLDAEEVPAEEPAMDAEEPAMDAEAGAEVELSPEDIKAARDAVEKLLAPLEAELPAEGGEEMPAEEPAMDAEEPAMDAEEPEVADAAAAPEGEEEEVIAEALSGINLELSGDELVQEVAKRVAKRLLQAKKAQKQLDEALGRKRK